MDFWYYIMIPFTWVLKFFYGFFNNYGIALILFTLVVKVILFPVSLKGKKSMIQMNMLSGRLNQLKRQYGKDQNRYNQEVQKLYEKENVNPTGGCLWSMIPLAVLMPLYAIIRRPLKYWLGLNDGLIAAVTSAVAGTGVVLSEGYPEITAASAMFTDQAALAAGQAAAGEATVFGINFSFLGIDLAATPTIRFWESGPGWAGFGLFLVPILTAATSFISSVVMNKTNQINSQSENSAASNKMMLWMMPLMMLWFSFIMPAGMGLYMICSSIFSMLQEVICGQLLKKDYEKAREEMRQRELEAKEEEKRMRRERAERKAREAEEARKNKGKKKPKDPDEEKMTPEQREAARVGMRPYARGRAYDPDRFGGVLPYWDPDKAEAVRPVPAKKKKKGQPEQPDAETAAQAGTPALESNQAGEKPARRRPTQQEKAGVLDAEFVSMEDKPAAEEPAPVAEPAESAEPAEEPDLAEQLQAEIDATLNSGEEPKQD